MFQLPGSVISTSFSGCVGDVSFDGKPIGLYNFRELVGSACSGCSLVPLPAAAASQVYSFDGYGYAVMPPIDKYKPNLFYVSLQFKTYWEDALLFFAYNQYNGDNIAIELVQGRVVFKFSFEGKATVVQRTLSKYNTNTWVSEATLARSTYVRVSVACPAWVYVSCTSVVYLRRRVSCR